MGPWPQARAAPDAPGRVMFEDDRFGYHGARRRDARGASGRGGMGVKGMMSRITTTAMMIGLAFCCVAACSNDSGGVRGGTPADEGEPTRAGARILFLHHSTGECVWNGGVEAWFDAYNRRNGTQYSITEQSFPKDEPYGWRNYPYDYWNIWVRHAGRSPYMTEPTLEMLAPKHDVIMFKHCFPVSAIEADTGRGVVSSEEKRIENYKLQYAALGEKLREFPDTRFIVWTGAALVRAETDAASARRAGAFFEWVRTSWDEPGDNIYLWDFYTLETEGQLYLKDEYASGDSHPNERFSRMAAPLLCQRIVDVLGGAGDTGSITGGGAGGPDPGASEPTAPVTSEPDAGAGQPAPDGGSEILVFDDAEEAARETVLWGAGGSYVKDGQGHAIRLEFRTGVEEDWGEYGRQRIVTTVRPARNVNVSSYRYLTLRVKSDRKMELVLTLITHPDSVPRTDESYFGFSAYLQPPIEEWGWIVLDLAALELGAEGDRAYAAAGRPVRPMELSSLRFVTGKANEGAACVVDDIVFYQQLPESLADRL